MPGRAACGGWNLRRGSPSTLEPPTSVAVPWALVPGAGLASSWVWWTAGLALASIVLAAVEHGWKTLSRTRLIESAGGPRSRRRVERMLSKGDAAEDTLLLLRVAVQVALAMGTVHVLLDARPEASLAGSLLWAGVAVFVWVALFCRVLPDELGATTLERMVRTTMPVVILLSAALAPPVDLLRKLLRRVTGHTDEAEKELHVDEILSTVEEGEREGHIEGDQADMIERVLQLKETEVHELMTPRTDLDVLDRSSTVGDARELSAASGHSRYPVVDGSVDKVVGVLHVKDLLHHTRGETLEGIMRPAWFVPESKYCTELLSEFRDQKTHLAVVLDEYGGTAGIITIEDVLEEIVGEIDDEFDEPEDTEELTILDSHHALAAGTIHVDELNDALGTALPESDDWSTLGGYIFSTLGRLPEQGEKLTHENVVLEVRSVVDRRVESVAVEILETAS